MGLFTWIMLCVFPPMRTFISQGVGYLVCVMNAKARGSVSITSKDPRAPLDIGTNIPFAVAGQGVEASLSTESSFTVQGA